MNDVRVYIAGMGIVSPLGEGIAQTREAIQKGLTGIRPLSLFSPASHQPLPVGEVAVPFGGEPLPRTHQLARLAADQAMAGSEKAPDAVVLGITTGGMPTTESHLAKKVRDPELFRYHAPGSVSEDIARRFRCSGPVLTVSTACSSGAVAIKIALEMLRTGIAKQVLAGGADSLCRLTYYGFNSLQLIDPQGARPLDQNRRGMSVAEGAAMLLLTVGDPDHAVAQVLGAGISCDAHHPVTPHPRGKGALSAMQNAIQDAGISLTDIDYINLHGTGTLDNDISEAAAVNTLFTRQKPLLSSVKGAFGHSLAAAGAIEAVISALCVSERMVPASIGCSRPDPDLGLDPLMQPAVKPIDTVLSNSFGFGGNNAALVIGAGNRYETTAISAAPGPMAILGCACVTGAGHTNPTMENIGGRKICKGMLSMQEIAADLSAVNIRRLKRFPRLALALAIAAHKNSGETESPAAVFLGTGWGAQSETFDFLTRLYETAEQFPSPTDFIGSVHNAAAGQIALQFQATGANITMTGGDYSFEQALTAAGLLSGKMRDSFLVIGTDESHTTLSRLFDRSVARETLLSDGGGAFFLKHGQSPAGLYLNLAFYQNAAHNPEVIPSLIDRLAGAQQINARYGAILAGIPAACRSAGDQQLRRFLSHTGYKNPLIHYRRLIGEYASASAVAAVMAAKFLEAGRIPATLCDGRDGHLNGKGVLVIGLGDFVTAVEVVVQ